MSKPNIDAATEAEIYRLADEGLSSRQIAKQLGVPRSTVKRRVDARREFGLDVDDDNSDLDPEEIARLNAPDSGYEPRAPFTFVGFERVGLPQGRGEELLWTDEERFLDSVGRSCSMADIYRADFQDGSVDRGYIADAMRQIEAADYRQADNGDGTWRWELRREGRYVRP